MKDIPFHSFDGFLKQHAHESLSALEQDLFDALFPSFQGNDSADKAYASLKNDPMLQALGGLITAVPGERRQRRFAGYDFPRSRYYSVASDHDGNDNQTLAHELRAYRNPIDYGMVEVIDLAGGCNLILNGEEIPLPAENGIAVLIHNLDLLPQKFRSLSFHRLPALKDKPLFLYRFPYKVFHKTIERIIDLRRPLVRDWFFDTFRIPSGETDSAFIKGTPDSTIAYSRFHLGDGHAPVPTSFWKMLPTLMNPDLGGGNPGTTGSTVLWIGHWMRQHEVSGFIYPSARCDVTALFEKGELQDFCGWNLVHYEDTAPFDGQAHLITFDPSPWAWVDFEDDVKLHVASTGDLAGSFKIDGMVNYWAKDYIGQIKALETARRIHGIESSHAIAAKEIRACGFLMGVLCLKWLRFVFNQQSHAVVEERLLELQGLALSFGIHEVTGRISELWKSVRKGGVSFGSLVVECVRVADRIGNAMDRKFSDASLGKLVQFGNDLEFLLLTADALVKQRGKSGQRGIPDLAERYESQLASWFDANTAKAFLDFLREMPRCIADGGDDTIRQMSLGESLVDVACKSLRA